MRRAPPVIAAIVILMVRTAAAQQPTDQEAVAVAQFERGLAAMNEGKYDVACPALIESVRLDPRAGAVFTLAECEARWGRVASADAHYNDYLARFARMSADQQKQQRGRDKIAEQKRAELRAQIPQLQLRLPPGAARAVVKRDGVVLGAPSLGVFLPVDPGTHLLAVEMPDGSHTEQTIALEIGGRRDVLLDLPPPAPIPTPPPREVVPLPTPPSSTPWPAYGALGLGVVGIGIGTGAGISALSKKSTIDAHCNGNVCDHEGKTAADEAKTAAVISTIGFAAGLAGVATGIIVLAMRPSRPSRAASQALVPELYFDGQTAAVGARGAF